MKKTVVPTSAVLCLIALAACATSTFNKHSQNKPKSEIVRITSYVLDFTKLNQDDPSLREKMGRFRKILLRGGPKSSADWKLHDDLLDVYIQIKSQNQTQAPGTIVVPARSRATYRLNSFCLNGNRAVPSDHERFEWKREDSGIPYFKEVLALVSKASEGLAQERAQGLIWNLQSGTYWEEYPEEMKEILLKIDPNAPMKLPSKQKERVKDLAKDLISTQVPGYDEVNEAIEAARGKYRRFEDVRSSIRELKSNYPLEPPGELQIVEDSPLYVETSSQGYSSQNATFYNPTDQSVSLNLTEYHLQPKRKDVQRIGLVPPSDKSSLLKDLEELLYGDLLRLGIGFTPGLNDVADLYEFLYGNDFVSGRSLSWDERLASGVGIALGGGAAYRQTKRWIYAPEKYLPRFESDLERVAGRSLGSPDYARVAIRLSESAQRGTELSQNLVYRGTKKLSELLRSNPIIEREERINLIRSFDPGSIKMRTIERDTAVYRWHNGDEDAKQLGRFLTPTRIEDAGKAREVLALPEKNRAKYLDEFSIKPGTLVFEGRIAPDFGHRGGEGQVFITGPLEESIHFVRRIR